MKLHSPEDFDVILNPNPSDARFRDLVKAVVEGPGWSYSAEDFHLFTTHAAKFWLWVALDKKTDTFVSSCSLCLHKGEEEKDDLLFVGYYFTRAEYRGFGIGSRLFKLLVEAAGDRNIGLFGVLNMVPLYAARMGFSQVHEPAFRTYTIKTADMKLPEIDESIKILPLKDVDFHRVAAFDRTILPDLNRAEYLRGWLNKPEEFVKVALSAHGEVIGFCGLRGFGKKIVVSPLYTNNLVVAQSLISSTYVDFPNKDNYELLMANAPAENELATDLYYGMNNGVACDIARGNDQFTNKEPRIEWNNVFSTLELSNSPI